MGLSRSFQITSIFHRLSVFENLRCALLWSMGYRYSFWTPLWRQRDLNERTADDAGGPQPRRGRDTAAGLLSYADQRALEIGMTIAGGASVILLDEPTAGMSNTETDNAIDTDPPGDRGQDAGHGRARHEGGVRSRRHHHRAGLRPGDRLGTAAGGARQSARCRKPISGRWTQHDARSQRPARLLRPEPHPAWRRSATSAMARSSACSGATASDDPPPARRSWGWWRRRARSDFAGRDIAGLRTDQVAHCRHRLCAGRPPDLPDADGAAKPGARAEARRASSAAGILTTSSACFPNLTARQNTAAGVLSGGEQQMLTMCRTLMGDPDLILIDEPTEGLAPKLVEQVGELLAEIARRGVSILLVEQKLDDRAEDFAPALRDGPRPDRVRGHAGRFRRQFRRPQGVAGGLSADRYASMDVGD